MHPATDRVVVEKRVDLGDHLDARRGREVGQEARRHAQLEQVCAARHLPRAARIEAGRAQIEILGAQPRVEAPAAARVDVPVEARAAGAGHAEQLDLMTQDRLGAPSQLGCTAGEHLLVEAGAHQLDGKQPRSRRQPAHRRLFLDGGGAFPLRARRPLPRRRRPAARAAIGPRHHRQHRAPVAGPVAVSQPRELSIHTSLMGSSGARR